VLAKLADNLKVSIEIIIILERNHSLQIMIPFNYQHVVQLRK